MGENREPANLEELLDKIEEAADQGSDHITLEDILNVVGRRSFGPLLLVAGIITLAPVIGDIPGVPSIMGMIVFLIAIQLLLRIEHFWLPGWLLKRSIEQKKLKKGLKWVRKPAQFIDRYVKQRLNKFTTGTATYVIAIVCMIIALAMPVMELVPFSANGAGLALTAFGLSIIGHDGLLAIIAFSFTIITGGVVIYSLL